MADPRGEDFLSRWSRRKQRAARQDADGADEETNTAPAEQELASETVDEEAEANRLAAEAVDIDALGKGDDFSIFLKRGVPAALRSKALRRLWRTNPALANLDGLNDYDTDFNDLAHKSYTSLWQAGRGYLGRTEPETKPDARDAEENEPAENTDAQESDASEPASAGEEREMASQAPLPKTVAGEGADIRTAAQEAGNEDEERRPRRVSIRRRLEG